MSFSGFPNNTGYASYWSNVPNGQNPQLDSQENNFSQSYSQPVDARLQGLARSNQPAVSGQQRPRAALPQNHVNEEALEDEPFMSFGTHRKFDYIPGSAPADCGQHAASINADFYKVAIVKDNGNLASNFDITTPNDFSESLGSKGRDFSRKNIPNNAEGVAFAKNDTDEFHYAKIERKKDGKFKYLTHTDTNNFSQPAHGSVMNVFSEDMQENIAQRAMQPPEKLNNLKDFVDYCRNTYGRGGLYFFCKFAAP